MLPDCPSARTLSVYATRIITTPGERSSTRPFMCMMPIHRAVDRVDPGVVEVVVHPVGLHRFQPRNILSILTLGKETDRFSGTGRGV